MNKLTGNKLKLIALISMTVDHIGKFFFPSFIIFEIIGRIAFPIFAYMIAEGWKYTSNKKRYMLTIWGMGVLYQIIYYIFYSSLYMGIFVTYGLSLLFIWSIEYFISKRKYFYLITPFIVLGIIFSGFLEYVIPNSDFAIDYGLVGVIIPVFVYFGKSKLEKICLLFLGLCTNVLIYGVIQIFSLIAIPLLLFYNGKRGNKNLKYLFYVYYPIHLVVIWLVGLFI